MILISYLLVLNWVYVLVKRVLGEHLHRLAHSTSQGMQAALLNPGDLSLFLWTAVEKVTWRQALFLKVPFTHSRENYTFCSISFFEENCSKQKQEDISLVDSEFDIFLIFLWCTDKHRFIIRGLIIVLSCRIELLRGWSRLLIASKDFCYFTICV